MLQGIQRILKRLNSFYIDSLGFDILGEFHGHDGYDGIFIGRPNMDWHLEFTVSDHAPNHIADEDDLLVFYIEEDKYKSILNSAQKANIREVIARNPYWNSKGRTYEDPDGFRVVIAIG